jgi:hypothetical protein
MSDSATDARPGSGTVTSCAPPGSAERTTGVDAAPIPLMPDVASGSGGD